MAGLPTRPLGDSGMEVSVIGLGCNQFGRRLDLEGTRAVVDTALELGVTFFDTADIYGGQGKSEEKTDFSELTASFRIANGVAHNDDLTLKSPLFRVGGAGDVDIGGGRLDYTVKATIVSSLQGQGGPELEALKGVTVPVRLSGPFDKIGYNVDLGSVVTEKAKERLNERRDEVRKEAEDKLKDRLKGLLQR